MRTWPAACGHIFCYNIVYYYYSYKSLLSDSQQWIITSVNAPWLRFDILLYFFIQKMLAVSKVSQSKQSVETLIESLINVQYLYERWRWSRGLISKNETTFIHEELSLGKMENVGCFLIVKWRELWHQLALRDDIKVLEFKSTHSE